MVSNVKPENPIKKQKRKSKPNKSQITLKTDTVELEVSTNKPADPLGTREEEVTTKGVESISINELSKMYPIFKDEELVNRFLNVPLSNNQKGRVRLVLKDQLKATSDTVPPDVIYSKIQGVINDSNDLTEPELRKIRILYNMLKTAVQTQNMDTEKKKKNKHKKSKKTETEGIENGTTEKLDNDIDNVLQKKVDVKDKDAQDKTNKVKGPKRYVVFVGNLPANIETETIMKHFKDLADNIQSVRIPKLEEGKKSSIAYLELKNEHSYELALSKHHSMMGTKRINVLYTTQKNSKISKTEAKSKSAKLIALQKSGQLAGSVPLNRKRSYRRAKAKRAQAQERAATITRSK